MKTYNLKGREATQPHFKARAPINNNGHGPNV